jgi:hypothetical protein
MASEESSSTSPILYRGSLPSAARGMNQEAMALIYQSLVPLEASESFSNVVLEMNGTPDETGAPIDRSGTVEEFDDKGSVTLTFVQSMGRDEIPTEMHLMYAIGSTCQLGVHATRSCFDIFDFPTCPTDDGGTVSDQNQYQDHDSDSAACAVVVQYRVVVLSLLAITTFVLQNLSTT